jgi:gluconokinase
VVFTVILIVIGVSGSGKTSVGQDLGTLMGWSFLDADDYHPEANIAKMSRGEPLNDADRAPWLNTLCEVIESQIQKGEDTILACSALKKSYRAQLSQAHPKSVCFAYLKVSPELLQERMKQRKDHFMKSAMLLSQLETLEEPETSEALTVDVQADASPEMLAAYIRNQLLLKRN